MVNIRRCFEPFNRDVPIRGKVKGRELPSVVTSLCARTEGEEAKITSYLRKVVRIAQNLKLGEGEHIIKKVQGLCGRVEMYHAVVHYRSLTLVTLFPMFSFV
jgi:hypothetical protein